MAMNSGDQIEKARCSRKRMWVSVLHLLFKFTYFEGERECVHKWGRGRERGRENLRLRTVSAGSTVGLKLMSRKMKSEA